MAVRAKFFVKSLTHLATSSPDDVAAEIALIPVYGDSAENKSWSKYTPSGELKMIVTNPGAIAQFELGKAYFLDFTPAA